MGRSTKDSPFHFHGREHVLLVVIPVTGSFVQIHSTDTGGHNMQIAQSSLFILDIVLDSCHTV